MPADSWAAERRISRTPRPASVRTLKAADSVNVAGRATRIVAKASSANYFYKFSPTR